VAASGLYAAFDAADYDQVKIDTTTTDPQDGVLDTVRSTYALSAYLAWQKALLKDTSYNVSCWKLTKGNGSTYATGTDEWGGAGKCTKCSKSGESAGADKCVNDYYPLMQDATSGQLAVSNTLTALKTAFEATSGIKGMITSAEMKEKAQAEIAIWFMKWNIDELNRQRTAIGVKTTPEPADWGTTTDLGKAEVILAQKQRLLDAATKEFNTRSQWLQSAETE